MIRLSCVRCEHPAGCWRERRRLCPSTVFLFHWKQLAWEILDLMSPSLALGRVAECSCQAASGAQEAHRSSVILQITSSFLCYQLQKAWQLKLPPINPPTKENQMCLLYWPHSPAHPEKSLKNGKFSFFSIKKKKWGKEQHV